MLVNDWRAASLASLPPGAIAQALADLTDDEAESLLYDWQFWARPNQLEPPGNWRTWLVLAGRGFGKTRTGAEWVRSRVARGYRRLGLIAPTAADARDVMVEGESGILAISPPWDRPKYEPSKRRLTWPNGALATLYSADEPDRLRGPQHDALWADEAAAWKYREAWDMAMFGLRLGSDPRACVTTTPKPVPLVRELVRDSRVTITRGSTFDNAANLAPAFLEQIIRRYQGTRLGRQELEAELLEDTPGALWQLGMFEREGFRLELPPVLERVVVAVDPAASSNDESDETGIIVAGRSPDGRGYVLADLSLRASPGTWASEAVRAYLEHRADRIVAERNNGGEMVEYTIRTVAPNVPVTTVWASRGKQTRAEPVAALYEQHRIHHVGLFPELESQLTGWVPGMSSPDRLDALVWALTDLMLEPETTLEPRRSTVRYT